MLTLFHAPRSRSMRILWLLEELGCEYEIRLVDIRRRDFTKPDYLNAVTGARDPENPHPHGKVPAIVHDGKLIFESAAICAYLTDAFPEKRIGPLAGDPARGAYLSWLAYYAGVFEPAFTMKRMGVGEHNPSVGWVPVEESMGYILNRLEKAPHLLGNTFSAADILFGSAFALFMGSPMLAKNDILAAYVDRLTERPAYKHAWAKDNMVCC